MQIYRKIAWLLSNEMQVLVFALLAVLKLNLFCSCVLSGGMPTPADTSLSMGTNHKKFLNEKKCM